MDRPQAVFDFCRTKITVATLGSEVSVTRCRRKKPVAAAKLSPVEAEAREVDYSYQASS